MSPAGGCGGVQGLDCNSLPCPAPSGYLYPRMTHTHTHRHTHWLPNGAHTSQTHTDTHRLPIEQTNKRIAHHPATWQHTHVYTHTHTHTHTHTDGPDSSLDTADFTRPLPSPFLWCFRECFANGLIPTTHSDSSFSSSSPPPIPLPLCPSLSLPRLSSPLQTGAHRKESFS